MLKLQFRQVLTKIKAGRGIAGGLFVFLIFLFGNQLATAALSPYQFVKVKDQQLLVDFERDGLYTPFIIKGVGYSPTPIGRYSDDWGYPSSADPRPKNLYDDPTILNRDFSLLKAMNANVVRFWSGNNTQVTFADTQNPRSPWYLHYSDIGRFPNYLTEQTFNLAEANSLKIIAGFAMPWPGSWTCQPGGAQYQRSTDFNDPYVRSEIISKFRTYVLEFKDHPALLFWAIGNENNLGFNNQTPEGKAQIRGYYSLIQEMAQEARIIEGAFYHPVAIVNGELSYIGKTEYSTADTDLSNIDIWGANIYRGASFGSLFNDFASLSNKAFWISEYGEDAWRVTDRQHPEIGYEDQITQAAIGAGLWNEIKNAYLNRQSIGGTMMEYSDEWFKPYTWLCEIDNDPNTTANGPGGCNLTHNFYGIGPEDSSCPKDGIIDWNPPSLDHFFNEEWFGIMAISPDPRLFYPDVMTPRKIYTTLQQQFASVPDLVVTALSSLGTGKTGAAIVIDNSIKNQGGTNSSSFVTAFYLSTDSVITIADTRIGTRTINSLNAGASSIAATTLTIPNTLTPGTYYLGAIADYNNVRIEQNENNNTLLGNSVSVTPGADLVMTAVSGPATATRGSSVAINSTVANQGTGSAGSFYVGLYLSSDSVITMADRFLGSRFLSSLSTGGANAAVKTVTIPTSVTAGTYYIGAFADYKNQRPEQNETNNGLAGNTMVVQ